MIMASKNQRSKPAAVWHGVWPALLVAVVVIGLWYSASHFWGMPKYILPAPDLILKEAIENPNSLLRNGWVTLVEATTGFAVGV